MSKRILTGAVLLVVTSSCASAAPPEEPLVRDSDLEAWQGVGILELERHPLFSRSPVTKKPISAGSEIWDYVTCLQTTSDDTCRSAPGGFGSRLTR